MMMIYVWSRRNPNVVINLLEIFQVRAAYLPYCIVLLMLLFGSSLKYDIIGIIAGHLYYYLEDVVPNLPETEGIKVLTPPKLIVQICEYLHIHDFRLNEEDLIFE